MKIPIFFKKHVSAVALLLALILLITTATGCTDSFANDAADESGTGEETTDEGETTAQISEVEMPSEELLRYIESDYGKKLFGTEYDSKKHGEIQILCCYGDYSGSIPVILGGSGVGDVMTEEWSEKISQYEFWYSERCRIEVWHEGSFYNLQEAYDKGLLMEKDLGLIAKIHYDKNVSDFGENFNK